MSQWTHVNASIRFDSIMGMGLPSKEELGVICRWEDENWADSVLPKGSEGSIEYTIVKTGSKNSIANTVIVFTGDLRDYEDLDEILTYFKTLTKGKFIRSGILEISVEYQSPKLFRFDNDKKDWVEWA